MLVSSYTVELMKRRKARFLVNLFILFLTPIQSSQRVQLQAHDMMEAEQQMG